MALRLSSGRGRGSILPIRFANTGRAVALALVAASCGLEEYPYLDPPVSLGTSIGYFSFQNDEDNPPEPDCQGYEFYYRIYDEESAAEADASAISGYVSNLTPDTVLQNMKSSLGYKRLSRESGSQIPLLELSDPGDTSIGNIDLVFVSTYEPYVRNAALGLELGAPGTPSDLELFRKPDDADDAISFKDGTITVGDADYKHTAETPSAWYIQIYALSFGTTADFKGIYSTPALLGRLELPY